MGTSPGDYLTDSGPAARWDLRRARSDLDGLVGSHDMEGGTGLGKGSCRVTRATHIVVVPPPSEYLAWGRLYKLVVTVTFLLVLAAGLGLEHDLG